MADTQLIKRVIEPHIDWLETQFPGSAFTERPVQLPTGSFKFDAVAADESVVAVFLSNRSKTSTGNENTGGVRKALNDIQYLKLVDANSAGGLHRRPVPRSHPDAQQKDRMRRHRFRPVRAAERAPAATRRRP